MKMERQNKYLGDDKFKKFLEHYECPTPLDVVKMKFAGAFSHPYAVQLVGRILYRVDSLCFRFGPSDVFKPHLNQFFSGCFSSCLSPRNLAINGRQ